MVAEAFIGPRPFPEAQICHWDGNRTNNHYSNLRWGTAKDNKNDSKRHGTLARGERQGLSKLTANEVLEMRRLRRMKGMTSKLLAIFFDYKVTAGNICAITRKKPGSWSWLQH
jgi:hypothetical protein